MHQGILLSFVQKRRNAPDRTLSEALGLCRNAGFTELDYLTDVKCADYLQKAEKARKEIDRHGLKVHQSHCPFFRYTPGGEALFGEYAVRAVEAAAILGAEHLVIHADEYRVTDSFDEKKILSATQEYLAPVVEKCVGHGIHPAIENLFEDNYGSKVDGRSRYTSKTEEVLNIIEKFPGTGIGCCWDFGHALCSYGDRAGEELKKVLPYLLCTHVHDNSYGIDMHKPAFFGTADWEKTVGILKNSNYSGNFTWEFVYERFPDALFPDYLKFVHKIGEYLLAH